MPRLRTGFATLRDAATYGLGVGVLVWVVIVRDGPVDPIGVGLAVALLGLPSVLLPSSHHPSDPPPPTPGGGRADPT